MGTICVQARKDACVLFGVGKFDALSGPIYWLIKQIINYNKDDRLDHIWLFLCFEGSCKDGERYENSQQQKNFSKLYY